MIRGKTVLGFIPARGGSKGLPRKNILPLGGKPLLAWTIEAAKCSRYIDRIIVSSEDAEILSVARAWDCETPFERPAELAADETPGIAPVLHALEVLPERYDYVVLLQPTSPLRTAEDIDGCIDLCDTSGAPACVSVTPAAKPPEFFRRMDSKGRLIHILDEGELPRRQDHAPAYLLNGAIYAARVASLLDSKNFFTSETVGYIMPPERSPDIDTINDFLLCEALVQQRLSQTTP
jgi:N-acylneuraminate cytidylyltransferase